MAAAQDRRMRPRPEGYDWTAIVKDLIGTALLALAIFGPIVGLKTVTASGTLVLLQRWGEVAVIVAITVAGRLCIHLYQMMKPKAAAAAPAKAASAKPEFAIGKYLGPIMLVIAIALPFIAGTTGDRTPIIDLGIYILTYVMLGWGLNIVVGLAGLLDLGYVAFYAVGAYTYALLSTVYFPYWFGDGIVPWAFYITLPHRRHPRRLWGVILGFPVLRLRGDYLAIVTLAFGEIIRLVLHQLVGLHRRPAGIDSPARPPSSASPSRPARAASRPSSASSTSRIYRIIFLYYVILVLALLTYFVT